MLERYLHDLKSHAQHRTRHPVPKDQCLDNPAEKVSQDKDITRLPKVGGGESAVGTIGSKIERVRDRGINPSKYTTDVTDMEEEEGDEEEGVEHSQGVRDAPEGWMGSNEQSIPSLYCRIYDKEEGGSQNSMNHWKFIG